MRTKAIVVLVVLMVAAVVVIDRIYFAAGNVPRVVDSGYGVAAWPASPEFSIKSHSLVRTQYTRDWDGTGKVMQVSRVSRNGLTVHRTTFTYKRGETRLRICDTRPARLRFEVCGFAPFHLSQELLDTPPHDLIWITNLISITSKDHAGYFLLAVRKGERLLKGTDEGSMGEEFPEEPAYAMLR